MLLFDSGDPGGDAVIQKLYQACLPNQKCLYVGKNKHAYMNTYKFTDLAINDLKSCTAYIFSSSVHEKIYLKRYS